MGLNDNMVPQTGKPATGAEILKHAISFKLVKPVKAKA